MSFLTLKYRKSRQAQRTNRTIRIPVSPASRSKRNAASPTTSPQATGSGDGKQSIKLTMKVAPSKLREVMRANEVDALKDTLGGGTVLNGPRSRRNAASPQNTGRAGTRTRYVEPQESDLEDEEEEDEDEDEDAEAEEDTTMNDFDEIGAEAEGGTDDEDAVMEDARSLVKKNQNPPIPPKITLKTPSKKNTKQSTKPSLVVTPADVGPVQPVEDEEMQDDPGEDDMEDSELPEDETNINEEDAEGEDDVEGDEDEELEEDDDELGDSDEEAGSGAGTPDPSKLTSRQRGGAIEPLMALDMAPQQRKFFTDAEKAMKKDEHARKRKELTKRKIHEEKTAALNRLLKPQVSKSRGAAPKAGTLAAQMQAAAEEEELEQKADPLFTRWVSSKDGIKLGIPEEWLGKNVGRYFGPPLPPSNGALVQEVE
ncbi:hypothetical protein PMZ80_003503 [Knufia obscura]|uniref:INO80 complex subunit B-like conserved region domain-containing protein n=1 Tax=Knufia obscura TaxID=1635080 RepID=A0ABR0RUD4_9EURO|nr:hypothetical protein PMZ80_003503 [Knufia obscura]